MKAGQLLVVGFMAAVQMTASISALSAEQNGCEKKEEMAMDGLS